MRRLVVAVAVLGALSSACSSSDDANPVVTDSGRRDTATGDTSNVVDSAVGDTSTPPSDTAPMDTGTGKTCNTHAGDECDMVKQDCADPTATCIFDGKTAMHNVCVKTTTGTKLKGEACSSANDCDRGLFCVADHCAPACCPGDNSPCGAGGACALAINDPDTMKVEFYACSYAQTCDPFKYNCPSGQVCLFNDEPDVFKIDREMPNGHLSFGFGLHTCAGNLVARLEATTLLRSMATRISAVERAGVPRTAINYQAFGHEYAPLRLRRA